MGFGVVLKNSKKISGYDCNVRKYAVGFGNTFEEANKAAERNKNLEDKNSSSEVYATFNCGK